MVGAGPAGKSSKDWHEVWKNSQEAKDVVTELGRIKDEMGSKASEEDEGSTASSPCPSPHNFTKSLFVSSNSTGGHLAIFGQSFSSVLLQRSSLASLSFMPTQRNKVFRMPSSLFHDHDYFHDFGSTDYAPIHHAKGFVRGSRTTIEGLQLEGFPHC